MRARVRAWRGFRRWLRSAGIVPRQASARECADYLWSRAAEPCGLSVLEAVMAMFGFVDEAYSQHGLEGWRGDPLVRAAYKEAKYLVAQRGGGDARGKAQRPPVRLLMDLERVVIDKGESDRDRMLSWWLLLSSWCALRFSDHRWLIPTSFKESGGSWKFLLTWTKTTGPGKVVKNRTVPISAQAYFFAPKWFEL